MKIMTTALLAILLTACGADDHAQEKKVQTKTTQTQEKAIKTTASTTTTETKHQSTKTVQKTTPAEKPTTAAQPKPIFDLVDSDGKILHVDEVENGVIFQEHKDKVVFLLFFGHRCPPCLAEIPDLIELQKEKGDKLAIIAMEVQGLPAEQLNAFKASKKINYTVLSDSTAQNSQFVSYIAQRAQWRGSIPFLVGISPNGEVNFVHVGGIHKNSLEQIFEQLAQQK